MPIRVYGLDTTRCVSPCGKRVDAWGDHSLGCSGNNKTAPSNAHHDGLFDSFKTLLPVAILIQSTGQVEKEIHNIVHSLPTLKTFDVSIRLDHHLSGGAWRTPFARLGFDITFVHSTKSLPLPPSTDETAPSNERKVKVTSLLEGLVVRTRCKGKTPFDGSYLSSLPSFWANQQLGLVCCSHQLANHINASFNHLRHDPSGSEEVLLDDDDVSLDDLDEPDWNWVEEELMVDDADDFPAVGGSKTSIDVRVHVGEGKNASLITGLGSRP
jgi:hypothetical protein